MDIDDGVEAISDGSVRPQSVLVREEKEFVATAAAWIDYAVVEVLGEKERCTLALAGGNTPRAIYELLAERYVDLPWSLVDIYFGDERRVPPDDPASNYRMAREALLGRVPIDPARVYRMAGEGEDAMAAAREYEELLPASLDVLLLGIGSDGHTASLFPDAPELRERERRVLPSVSPSPPPGRLTITPPVIRAARRLAVFAAGAGKARAVASALEGSFDPAALPVQLALRGCWILDHDAASLLSTVRA